MQIEKENKRNFKTYGKLKSRTDQVPMRDFNFRTFPSPRPVFCSMRNLILPHRRSWLDRHGFFFVVTTSKTNTEFSANKHRNDSASPQTIVNKHAGGAIPSSCFIPNARVHPRCPLALRSWNTDAPNRKYQKKKRDPLRNKSGRGAPHLDSRHPWSQKS